jgi:hypothetical protein
MLDMCDRTFSLFSGITKTIHMGDRMTNHIMHGLSNNKIWLIMITKKGSMVKKKLVVRDP